MADGGYTVAHPLIHLAVGVFLPPPSFKPSDLT